MGFERVVAVHAVNQGFTDFSNPTLITIPMCLLLSSIKLKDLSGKTYESTLPSNGKPNSDQEETDIAFRVIGIIFVHFAFQLLTELFQGTPIATMSFEEFLRRGVRYGRNLGFDDPFFHKLAPVLIDQLGSIFPELEKRKDLICKTLQSEETSFNKTLDRGIDLFNREIKGLKDGAQIPGRFAFKLYDTLVFHSI